MTFDFLADLSNRPTAGNLIIAAIGTLKNRLFMGRLTNLVEPDKEGWYRYECDAESIEADLRAKKIYETFTNSYARDIIKSLLTSYAPLFIWRAGNDRGAYITSITFRGDSLYTILQDLAARSGVNISISTKREISFIDAAINSSAFDIDDNALVNTLTIREDASQIATQVVVLYTELQEFTENFVGDGTMKQFSLAMPAHSVTTLTVNGSAVTYDERNKVDNSGNDFSVSLEQGVIYTSAHATLTGSDTLSCTYDGKVDARVTVTDTDSKLWWSNITGTDGISTLLEEDRTILDYDEAVDLATAIIAKHNNLYYEADYTMKRGVFDLPNIKIDDEQTISARSRSFDTTINSINISIFLPGLGDILQLQYDVKLAERQYQIEQEIKSVEDQKIQKDDEIIQSLDI
jgi:hypothetical protein